MKVIPPIGGRITRCRGPLRDPDNLPEEPQQGGEMPQLSPTVKYAGSSGSFALKAGKPSKAG